MTFIYACKCTHAYKYVHVCTCASSICVKARGQFFGELNPGYQAWWQTSNHWDILQTTIYIWKHMHLGKGNTKYKMLPASNGKGTNWRGLLHRGCFYCPFFPSACFFWDRPTSYSTPRSNNNPTSASPVRPSHMLLYLAFPQLTLKLGHCTRIHYFLSLFFFFSGNGVGSRRV